MKLRSAILLPTFMCLMPLAAQEPAAEKPPDEIVQLRRQFELNALDKAKLLSLQFSNALAGIVKEAAAEGDYEQALTAQRRRDQLISLYSQSLDESGLSNVILLKPADARVNGAVGYDRNLNALVGWKTAGSIGSWDALRLTPGSYEITLTYAAAGFGDAGRINPFAPPPDLSTGGEFEFYEDSNLPGAEQNRRTGTVASTGGWTNWTTLTLPPIQITRSSARFVLKITKARGTGGVMNLKGIRLAPSSATPGAGGPQSNPQDGSTPPADELAALQQAYQETLRQAVAPVVNAFAENMKALAAKHAGDPEAAEDYTAEARRAEQLLQHPQNIISGLPKAGPRQGEIADGFRELRDAAYVQGDSNTGDRFKIKHGNEEFFVRLLWVRCPSPDINNAKQHKDHADYFGISMGDVRELGQQAKEFTAGFLTGKPLTLLTRGIKDESGDLPVLVRPAGVGDFAGVLVDHGLAMIKPPPGKKSAARLQDDSILRDLQEREKAAKARVIPSGAWARKSVE